MEGPAENRRALAATLPQDCHNPQVIALPMPASLFQRCRVLAAALLAAAPAAAMAAERADRPVQFVAISFDGAREIKQWNRSRTLARRTGARFTYFLSCVYLLTADDRALYRPPQHGAGKSNVGFAASRDDVAERLRQVWAARLEGHEIANHGCGHFDGGGWTESDWEQELAAFSSIMGDAWTISDIPFEPAGWRHFVKTEIKGFRAPYLSVGPQLAPALGRRGFHYDASTVSRDPQMPTVKNGVALFSLPLIAEGPKARRVLAMDYNLYVRHSAALERPSESALFEERAYGAFKAAFEKQYRGDRAPLQIGFHFRLMNDGAYWRALERFAHEICPKPDVRCVSYSELAKLLAPPTSANESALRTATD